MAKRRPAWGLGEKVARDTIAYWRRRFDQLSAWEVNHLIASQTWFSVRHGGGGWLVMYAEESRRWPGRWRVVTNATVDPEVLPREFFYSG